MSLPPAAINRVVIPSPVEGNPATPPTTTVIIVDDHRSFADLLAAALNTVSSMRCVPSCGGHGQELLGQCLDLALMAAGFNFR